MKPKNKNPGSGIVYSTNPDFDYKDKNEEENSHASPGDQKLKLRLEKRRGKTVTVLEGYQGSSEALEELAKKLKSHCGTGGTAKEGQVLIQGDNRDKILQWLLKSGLKNVKKV